MDHLHSSLRVAFAQFCDKGQKPENQDTVGARIPEGNALLTKGIAIAIADGVSSSASAKQASQTAVTSFLTDYYATPDTWRTQQSAMQVIKSLNQYLWGQSRNNVRQEGLLTTFSCLILKGNTGFIFHVGDTRVYRLREQQLELLTRDHSQYINKNTSYLSRALGADVSVEVDFYSEEILVGDIFILSSDGIHDAISRDALKALIVTHDHVDDLCQAIASKAIENKSDDNLSVQVVRIEQLGTSTQDDAVTALSQLPFPPPLGIHNKIDGMEVLHVMHESERSQVYLVAFVDANGVRKKAVMKTPSDNYSDDPAYIERFVMESWIGSRISNPHVVRIMLPPNERGFLYYLTEYIPGPTLAQIIRERAPLNVQDAIELLEQMIKGIRSFHRKDTLHQDIKPENIVIGVNGATIIDFGSCWVAGVEEAGSAFERDKILGTLRYAAPEYRIGGAVGQKSDQFSLALLCYEMLTNRTPYGEKYEAAVRPQDFEKIHYISASKINPLVPFWLDKALEKALSIEPEKRYDALSEWFKDMSRPNPQWLQHHDKPLLKRDPLLSWKIIAIVGWLAFFITLGFYP